MNEERASSPEEFKRRSRRILELPSSGLKVEIRRLTVADYIPLGILPVGYMDMKEGEIRKSVEEQAESDPHFLSEQIETVVAAGVVDPLVVRGFVGDAPEDAIHVSDLGDDLIYTYNEIMTLSGLLGEAAAKAVPFSEERVGKSPGPDGDEVGG